MDLVMPARGNQKNQRSCRSEVKLSFLLKEDQVVPDINGNAKDGDLYSQATLSPPCLSGEQGNQSTRRAKYDPPDNCFLAEQADAEFKGIHPTDTARPPVYATSNGVLDKQEIGNGTNQGKPITHVDLDVEAKLLERCIDVGDAQPTKEVVSGNSGRLPDFCSKQRCTTPDSRTDLGEAQENGNAGLCSMDTCKTTGHSVKPKHPACPGVEHGVKNGDSCTTEPQKCATENPARVTLDGRGSIKTGCPSSKKSLSLGSGRTREAAKRNLDSILERIMTHGNRQQGTKLPPVLVESPPRDTGTDGNLEKRFDVRVHSPDSPITSQIEPSSYSVCQTTAIPMRSQAKDAIEPVVRHSGKDSDVPPVPVLHSNEAGDDPVHKTGKGPSNDYDVGKNTQPESSAGLTSADCKTDKVKSDSGQQSHEDATSCLVSDDMPVPHLTHPRKRKFPTGIYIQEKKSRELEATVNGESDIDANPYTTPGSSVESRNGDRDIRDVVDHHRSQPSYTNTWTGLNPVDLSLAGPSRSLDVENIVCREPSDRPELQHYSSRIERIRKLKEILRQREMEVEHLRKTRTNHHVIDHTH